MLLKRTVVLLKSYKQFTPFLTYAALTHAGLTTRYRTKSL